MEILCRHVAEPTAGATARRDSEGDLRLLASIVKSAGDALIGKTSDGLILSWNPGAERIFGYSAEEIKGKPSAILAPPDHHEEEARNLDKIRRGERVDHLETIRLRKNGEQIIVSLTMSLIKDSTGTIIGASTITRDITEDKRAQEVLRQSEQTIRGLLNAPTDMALMLLKDLISKY